MYLYVFHLNNHTIKMFCYVIAIFIRKWNNIILNIQKSIQYRLLALVFFKHYLCDNRCAKRRNRLSKTLGKVYAQHCADKGS